MGAYETPSPSSPEAVAMRWRKETGLWVGGWVIGWEGWRQCVTRSKKKKTIPVGSTATQHTREATSPSLYDDDDDNNNNNKCGQG